MEGLGDCDCWLLDENLLRILQAHGCNTVMDFLDRDQDVLTNTTKIPPHIIRKVRSHLLDRLHPVNFCAGYRWRYLPHFDFSPIPITFGVESLDKFLCGNLIRGQILELCGPPLSGKTQLFYRLMANTLRTDKSVKFWYMDTSGQFNLHGLLTILTSMNCEAKERNKMLNRVNISLVGCASRLLQLLQFCASCSSPGATYGSCVVIIDSLHGIMSPLIGSQSSSEPSLLNAVGQALGFLTTEFGMTIVYTNAAYPSNDDVKYLPALGSYWRSVPHHRLLLTSLSDKNSAALLKTRVTVLKSMSMPCNTFTEIQFGAD